MLARRIRAAAITTQPPQNVDYTPWLAFDMPKAEVLAAGKPVVGHPMGNFIVNVSNVNQLSGASDYWLNNWRADPTTGAYPPNAAEAWQQAGGECRDWPIRRASRAGLTTAQAESADVRDWVAELARNGMDVVAPHFPSNNTGSTEFIRATRWLDAAIEAGVYWTPWVDGSTSIADTTSSMSTGGAALANLYATKSAGFWHKDGRPVFICYSPNQAGPDANSTNYTASAKAVWQALRSSLIAGGIPNPYLWVIYQSGTWYDLHTQYNAGTPVFDACSRFGERDPVISAGANDNNANAAIRAQSSFAQPWLSPCSARGYYPRGGTNPASPGSPRAWEPRGFEQLITSAMNAIDKPNVGGMCWNTLNDFPEHTHLMPSSGSKRNWMEILAYFNVWFKTGSPPPIIRDVAYIAHRRQLVQGTTYTGTPPTGTSMRTVPYSSTGWPNFSNGATPVNRVSALVFLKAPATVTITVNGTPTIHECPAGMNHVWAPAQVSSTPPSLTITHSGSTVVSLSSRKRIRSSLPWEDLDEYVTGSTESVSGRPPLYADVMYDDTLGDVE